MSQPSADDSPSHTSQIKAISNPIPELEEQKQSWPSFLEVLGNYFIFLHIKDPLFLQQPSQIFRKIKIALGSVERVCCMSVGVQIFALGSHV